MGVIIKDAIKISFKIPSFNSPNILDTKKTKVDIIAHNLGLSVISSTLDNAGIKSILMNSILKIII
jgi:hypothetical protein